MTVDVKRALVFVPIGTPNFDFYGGSHEGSNLYGSSLIALDGTQEIEVVLPDGSPWQLGLRQLLRANPDHGNQERKEDSGCSPDSEENGLMFIFNRETGKPLYDVKEVPVKNDNPNPGDSN